MSIAFLIAGQMRENPLGCNPESHYPIIESHSQFIFSSELQKIYPDYNVYICTDNINKNKCFDYFGKKIKGLICTDEIDFNIPYFNYPDKKFCVSFYRTKLALELIEKVI